MATFLFAVTPATYALLQMMTRAPTTACPCRPFVLTVPSLIPVSPLALHVPLLRLTPILVWLIVTVITLFPWRALCLEPGRAHSLKQGRAPALRALPVNLGRALLLCPPLILCLEPGRAPLLAPTRAVHLLPQLPSQGRVSHFKLKLFHVVWIALSPLMLEIVHHLCPLCPAAS